jgi:hypothetical protein
MLNPNRIANMNIGMKLTIGCSATPSSDVPTSVWNASVTTP